MPQYILFLHETPTDYSGVSAEEIGEIIAEYSAWVEKVKGSGMKLKDEGGKHISMEGDNIRITDGPYAEAKEVIGGFFVIEAANYEEAAKIAGTCPHAKYGTKIELREVEPT